MTADTPGYEDLGIFVGEEAHRTFQVRGIQFKPFKICPGVATDPRVKLKDE